MTNFSDFGLAAPVLRALEGEGYAVPTPIQAQAIPPILAGRDVVGIAQTGTGKTAAFALPILTRLAADRRPPPRKGCRVLVLSPTRELASQIAQSFAIYGAGLHPKVAAVFGGVGHQPQIEALARGLDVLVATPGRLLDHLDAGAAALGGTEVLVLDEVDQMLDLGFIRPIRRIVGKLPGHRQNLFFSATMPPEIKALADEMLRDPVQVAVAPVATTVETVRQQVILVEQSRKRDLLVELFADPAVSRALVFTRTKHGADKVARQLEQAGIATAAIHGNKGQAARQRSLAAFKAGEVRALVATDVAARGLDIDAVSHVVNYELPDVAESYVHRIGRTARAGNGGIAIAFCSNEERDQLKGIEKLIRQRLPSEDRRGGEIEAAPAARPRQPSQAPRQRQPSQPPRQHQANPSPRPQAAARPQTAARPQAPAAGAGRPPLRPARPGRRTGGGNIASLPFMAAPARD